jgi:hypothetical protein
MAEEEIIPFIYCGEVLAFVPTLTAAAVALLSTKNIDQWTVLAISLLGFSVTLGIIFFEMRNTVLYSGAIDLR